MTQALTINARPEFGKLYGITHDVVTAAPIVRLTRGLKVGIGVPKGRAYMIFRFGGKWHIRYGQWDRSSGKDKLVMRTVFTGDKRSEAEAFHAANKETAAVSNRPQKLPYFTFTRQVLVEDANGKPAEIFEPDWDLIEAHGEIPKSIPIILTSDDPFRSAFQWWTATEMKCHGDGKLAERLVTAGSREDPGWEEAKRNGDKFFLFSPCYATGCEHAGKDCKPHGTLNLQLAKAMRIGTTAYFATTSEVSCSRIYQALEAIRNAVQRKGYSMAGIPLELVLSSFRANHEGKPSIQPCVHLELRASSEQWNQLLADNAWMPTAAALVTALPPAGAYDGEVTSYDVTDEEDDSAPVVVAADEFSESQEARFADDDEAPAAQQPAPAATTTRAKMDDVGDQLRARRAAEGSALLQAAVAPAPPDVPYFPWADQAAMNVMLKKQYGRVKPVAIEQLLNKHSKMYGTLKPDDPATLAFYNDLVTSQDLF